MSLHTADESEVRELAFILHDAIAGEWVTIRCPNQMSVKRLFNDLCELADAMGLAYDACRAVGCEQTVVGDSIRDGGIDFECLSNMPIARDEDVARLTRQEISARNMLILSTAFDECGEESVWHKWLGA